MKTIALFGAGKSSAALIGYLIRSCRENNWMLLVADADPDAALEKTGDSAYAVPVILNVKEDTARRELIAKADLVVSLLPPSLHALVAGDCVDLGKNMLTASYIDDTMRRLETDIRQKGLLFLCEMGLDPGIDHMSAMRLIDRVRKRQGHIRSFKSHCGGLIAPESDNNSWHYKISWNPRNVVMAGKAGAAFKENGKICRVPYRSVFENCRNATIRGFGELACYSNRDSLAYIPLYGLEEVDTFMRTTLRYPSFCEAWQALVLAGLTDETQLTATAGLSFRKWSRAIEPFITPENERQLQFLGLMEDTPVPSSLTTSAGILQYLLETRLAMQPEDKDMVIMQHELDYVLDDRSYTQTSTLIVKGENRLHTAMAKTVGLPLGIAARLILEDKMPRLTGLHIPLLPEIYEPVLEELALEGIVFKEEENVAANI